MKIKLFVMLFITITIGFDINAKAASKEILPGTYEDWGEE